jgi:hypothetical protein
MTRHSPRGFGVALLIVGTLEPVVGETIAAGELSSERAPSPPPQQRHDRRPFLARCGFTQNTGL